MEKESNSNITRAVQKNVANRGARPFFALDFNGAIRYAPRELDSFLEPSVRETTDDSMESQKMFRNNNRRVATVAAALIVAAFGLLGTSWGASGSAAPDRGARTVDPAAWRTRAYSKTSEFAQRLALLEFSEKDNPACEPTTKLLDEMRRKNYPIQRVERSAGGDVLFERYKVESVPTLVLLFDGKELGRIVVKKDDQSVTVKRLLALFQKGRDEVASHPRARVKEPEFVSQSKPALGFLFPRSIDRAATARAQAGDASAPEVDAMTIDSEVSILDARTEEISNLIGESRLEAATIRVAVQDPKGGVPREGVGSAIHYNGQYRETLTVVASSLFTGIADPISYPDVTVEIFNAETNSLEKVGAQCVHCDPDAGVAFVAAQVDSAVKPVAFLPKKTPLAVGERGVSFSRRGGEVSKTSHDVLAVDQKRFYENNEERSAYVQYVEVSNPPAAEDVGSALYVLRNGRFYFAGLFVSSGEKGCVVPASVVSQALLVNRNLTAVYRDQIANKFDLPATDAEIDAAIDRLTALDALRKEKENAPDREQVAAGTTDAPAPSFALSSPEDPAATPDVDFARVPSADPARVAERADVALANASGEQSNLSDFPSTAEDAFARSDALANSLAANAAFQTADEFRAPLSGESRATEAIPDASVAAAPSDSSAIVESDPFPSVNSIASSDPSATRSQLAFNDDPVANESNPFADLTKTSTVAATETRNSASFDDAAPSDFETPVSDRSLADRAKSAPTQSEALSSFYAADAARTTSSERIRSATFSDREKVETFNREEEQFESALDALRRRGMEGAEIICIVNWPGDAGSVRETEVVRVPRRTVLSNPSVPGAGVELADAPSASRAPNEVAATNATGAPETAPLTSNRPDERLYK